MPAILLRLVSNWSANYRCPPIPQTTNGRLLILGSGTWLTRSRQSGLRTVIDHLFEFGSINTEELQELYGYTHPPRAIRDVREAGIPIESRRVVHDQICSATSVG